MTRTADVTFPAWSKFLFKPYRYKVMYGGRGGGKSWAVARALLILGTQKPLRILCTREVQKSIQDSVHRLLSDQIDALNLNDWYDIQQSKIVGKKNDTLIIFAGLQHNINSLKSYEGVDIVWIEEAHSVSKRSWEVLIPTIRKEGSEIWVTFNPEFEDDPTYERFITHELEGSYVTKVNWRDNPWFPDVLKMEMNAARAINFDNYEHVWEGKCKRVVEGAIFAEYLEKAYEEKRIGKVFTEPGVPINTFWDLGRSDNTAIWFVQQVGMEHRLIDYYEANGQGMSYFIDYLARLGYQYGTHYLPHDATHQQLAAKSTIEQQLKDALRDNPDLGKTVKVVPRIPKKALAIDAARDILPRCYFNSEKVKDGLNCLRRYRYAVDFETGKVSKEPVHDIYSHGTDAFLTMAQNATAKPAQTMSYSEMMAIYKGA